MVRLNVLVLMLVFSQVPADVYMPGVNYGLPAVKVSWADIESLKKEMLANETRDVPINMVEAGGEKGGHQVGMSLVYRLKGMSTDGVVHDLVSEVYHVLEGSGTMVVGGTLVNARRRPVSRGNGPGISGDAIEGGQRIGIAKGDVLIVPAGTPHRFESTDEFTLYTVVRVDPSRATPLQSTSTTVSQ